MPVRAAFPIAIAALAALTALAACTRPYDPPQAEHPLDDPRTGAPIAFDGVVQTLRNSGKGSAQMIFAHGMCSHNHGLNWARRRSASMATALGVAPPDLVDGGTVFDDDGNTVVETKVSRFETADGRVDATFLIWGRAVDPFRAALDYENHREGDEPAGADYNSPERASLNAALRAELINRCFMDAIVYLGRNGDRIRAGMRKATCQTLGGTTGSAGLPSGIPDETVRCTHAGGERRDDPIILVPESLGSIILMDAFTALDGGIAGYPESRLDDVASIFLATNQIPLLGQGNAPPARAAVAPGGSGAAGFGSLARFLNRARPARRGKPAAIQVVGITDPNDLLSFRLLNRHLGGVSNAYRLTNVLVSNAPTYFGLLENPAKAHYDTERPEVFAIISNGSAALD